MGIKGTAMAMMAALMVGICADATAAGAVAAALGAHGEARAVGVGAARTVEAAKKTALADCQAKGKGKCSIVEAANDRPEWSVYKGFGGRIAVGRGITGKQARALAKKKLPDTGPGTSPFERIAEFYDPDALRMRDGMAW